MMTTWEEKGYKKGIEEGRKEAALEIAKKALEEGLEIDIIAEITGLTLDVLKGLKEEITKKD